MNNEFLDEALAGLKRGWSMMPIKREEGKVPAVRWKEYQTSAPDETLIKKWFGREHKRNLGLITGKVSRVFVADTDTQDALDYLISRGIPNGPYVQGSQPFKRHYYFNLPSFEVRNSASKIFAGLDIRGEGGYVVLPPSIHQNGSIYTWMTTPEESPIPNAPDWLLDELLVPEFVDLSSAPVCLIEPQKRQGHERYAQAALAAELERVASAPDGQKHDQLFKSSAAIGSFVPHGFWSEGDVEEMFFSAIAPRSKDKDGARKTIRDGIRKGMENPRRLPDNPMQSRVILLRGKSARAYIGGKPTEHAEAEQEAEPEAEGVDEDEKAVNNGIYAILNGRTVLNVDKTKTNETGQDQSSARHFICDWAAQIVGQVRDEDGETTFNIEGRARDGHRFELAIPANKLSDPKFVSGAFLNVVGVSPVPFAGMEKHIAPAMRSFSDRKTAKHIRQFRRVGWTKESEVDIRKREFIIPGMVGDDVEFARIPTNLAYRVIPPETNQLGPEALEAFKCLINAQERKHTLIALTSAFAAPLSLLCHFQGDKYAVFIAGQTGSFKTSFCQMLLCIFGDFAREETLIKFGMGTTANSLQGVLTCASSMPILVDNFKTNTGTRAGNDAVAMIQAALEGGEKLRLNRNADFRSTKPIHAWMILTGEDYVEDAASRARSLYLPFAYHGTTNENLSRVQELCHFLPQIGGHLLQWALTEEALQAAEVVRAQFGERRSFWAGFIRKQNREAVNAYRVASNLAVCESIWEMVQQCPAIGPHLKPYEDDFQEGILDCAKQMAVLTAETHEANRYIESLRELIASDRGYLCPRLSTPKDDERRLKIGWEDEKGVYLIPGVAFEAAVKAMASQGGLNSMSKNTLHKQLGQLGYLARTGKNQFTVSIRTGIDNTVQTVLHVKESAFYGSQEEDM